MKLYIFIYLVLLINYSDCYSQTIVGGAISSNTTWTLAGSPYIVQVNIAVMAGVELTIDSGVVVKFDAQKALQVFGTFRALGTNNKPIVFTSNLSTQQPGDWGYILFNNSSSPYNVTSGTGCILKYCTIEYGGGATTSYNGTIRLNNAQPRIDNCTIKNNKKTAIRAWNFTTSTLDIYNCDIVYNDVDTGAIYLNGGKLNINSCNISYNNSSLDTSNNYSCGGVLTYNSNVIIKSSLFDSNNSNAIVIIKTGTSLEKDSVISNTIKNNKNDGIFYTSLNSDLLNKKAVIDNNTLSNNKGNGCRLYFYFNSKLNGGVFNFKYNNFTITNNYVSNNLKNGVNVYFESLDYWDSDLYIEQNNFTITNNTIYNQTINGISFGQYQTKETYFRSNYFTVNDNNITGNKNGIYLLKRAKDFCWHQYNDFYISNNSIKENALNGIFTHCSQIGNATWNDKNNFNNYLVDSNVIESNLANGYIYLIEGPAQNTNNTVSLKSNTIKLNGINGIKIDYKSWNSYAYNNSIIINSNTVSNNYEGGIFYNQYSSTSILNDLKISQNKIISNQSLRGGGIRVESFGYLQLNLSQNALVCNKSSGDGGAIFLSLNTDSAINVSNNSIINNEANNSSALSYYGKGNLELLNNTILYNVCYSNDSSRAVYIVKGKKANYNNFYNSPCSNSEIWYNDLNSNILDAKHNYWMKNTSFDIDNLVWDFFDDQDIGIVDHSNHKTELDTMAPISPPIKVSKFDIGNGKVMIKWNSNKEADLKGYKIYSGLFNGDSFSNSLYIGLDTNYVLNGVSINDTIAVTAIDNQATGTNDQVLGHESWFGGLPQYASCSLVGHKENYENLIDLSINPNPAKDMVLLDCLFNGRLLICDITGKELRNKLVIKGMNLIDIRDLSNGIYTVTVTNDNNFIYTNKLVIAR